MSGTGAGRQLVTKAEQSVAAADCSAPLAFPTLEGGRTAPCPSMAP